MHKKNISTFLVLIFISSGLISQECNIDNAILEELKKDIVYLSDDKLEGRETGTHGEKKALKYLQGRFDIIGIKHETHQFQFNNSAEVKLDISQKDFFATRYSSSATIKDSEIINLKYGIHAPELDYSDYTNLDVTGKTVLINTSSPDGIHPHSKYILHHNLKFRAKIAQKKGAICVIFFTNNKHAETPREKFKKLDKIGIPVLFYNNSIENFKLQNISFELEINEKKSTGNNLIGYINNNSKNTIILGAHYDHIGWGKEGSRYKGPPAIHNGADDNASGVAALLQLSKQIREDNINKYNYIFIAFSGEEKGLLGSNAYIKNNMIDYSSVNYMINMDMIGRLDKEKNIQIYGTGTSPKWDNVIDLHACKDFIIRKKESGIGPSDHTTFYLQNIPVLHFFTGAHEDYHKPTDDSDKINYIGTAQIVEFIKRIISDLDKKEKLEFTKTKEETNKTVPKFSVTLGVVPDYLYEEYGMRIDGVSDERPADNAGIIKGDIIVKLGDVKVEDIYSYMKALSGFAKGEKTKVIVKREGELIEMQIIF